MKRKAKTANIFKLCMFMLSAMLLSSLGYAQDSANGLIYHGRVLKPNGDALEDASVNFTVRVYGTEAVPVAKRCLLYEETHSGVNMTGSLGTFELKIGEGTRTFTPPQVGAGGIGRLFLNSPSFTLTTTSCTAGTNDFTAESLDADREIEVTIQSGATVLNLPAQKLRAMPWAMQAMEIGGYSADYIAKLNAAVPNQMNAAALMYLSNNAVVNDNGTPTNYADDTVRLQNLINPTNPQDAATKDYVDTVVGSGYSAGNGVSISAGVVSTRVDNATIEFDGSGIMRVKALGIGSGHIADGAITAVKLNQMSATPGQVLKWNGSAWAPAADDDSATVYTAGDGLALTGSDFSVNVDNTTVELNSDTLRVKDGGISFAKLNSAGGTVNDGMIVSDSSGRLFKLQCAADQVPTWTMSNGWECINPSSLVGVQSTALTQNNIWVGNASNVAAAQALPTCGANQYITYNGTAWSCATDVGSAGAVASAQGTAAVKVNGDNAAHTGAVTISVDDATVAAKGLMQVGNGLQVAAGVVSVSAPTCTAGQYISYNGTTWSCTAPTDNDTTYTAGDALTLTAGDFDVNVDGSTIEVNGTNQLQVKDAGITAAKLNQMGASNNEVLKWNGSTWAPAADSGITAVTGQALTQHQIWQGNVANVAAAVTIPSCGANQYLKYNNAGGWTCENDAGASGTVADIASTAPVKVNGATTAQTGSVTISVDDATTGAKGIMQVGTGLGVTAGTVSVTYGTAAGTAAQGNDARLSDNRTPIDDSVTSAKILDGTIVNADVNAAANIDASKLGTGIVSNTEFNYLDGVTSAIQTQLDAKVANGGGTPSITTGTFATRPGFGTAGRIYIASDTNAIYRDTGAAWVLIGDGTGTGDVTDVTVSAPLAVTNSAGPNPNVSITAGGATGDILQWNGSAWANTTVATCAGGQYLSFNGTTWTCSAPAGTAYTAGNGLALTGNDFSVNVDNSTVELNSDTLRVKDAGITLAKINSSAYNTGEVASTLVMRDGSSNIEGSGVLADALIMKGATSGQVTLQAPAAPTSYSLTYPSAQGGSGQVLINNGSGVLSWGAANPVGSSLNQHQIWLGNVSNVAAAVTLPNCGANQVLKYDNASGFTCQNDAGASGTVADIASTAPVKVNGATTAQTGSVTISVDDATTGAKGIMQVGTGLSVSSGTVSVDYSGIVRNIAGTPSIETGTFAARPAFGTAGRIYIASDTNAIYRDTGAAWVLIGDGTGTGDVTDVTVSAPLAVTNSAGPNPNVSITAGGATGDILQWNGSAWANTTVATCAGGQYLSFNGTTWACSAPAGTAYTAGNGLDLTTNDFSVNVDDSTIEINADTLRVKDAGITLAKINSSAYNTGEVASTLVMRDGSSNIEGSGVLADALIMKGSTSGQVTLQAPVAPTSYALTFPSAQGGSGQVLQNNGSGVLSWQTPSSGISGLTTNKVPKAASATSINDSQITDNGASGVDFANSKIQFGGTLWAHKPGTENTFLGSSSGNASVSTGEGNTAIGFSNLTSIATGHYNVAIGRNSMTQITSGNQNIGIGYQTLSSNISANYNIALGSNTLSTVTAGNNTAIGTSSLSTITAGSSNTALGANAGGNANGASSANLFLGSGAGPVAAGAISNKLYIDNSANDTPLIGGDFSANTVDINGSLNINFAGGYLNYKPNATECSNDDYLKWDATNDRWICTTPSGGVGGTGTTGMIPKFSAASTIADSSIQDEGGGVIDFTGAGAKIKFNNVDFIRRPAATDNIGIGQYAVSSSTGVGNVGVGNYALANVGTGYGNTAMDGQYSNSTGYGNSSLGVHALHSNSASNLNVGVGYYAGDQLTGGSNTAVGANAIAAIVAGSNNTALGKDAGLNANGASTGNLFLGGSSGPTGAGAISNKLYIDNSANNTPLIGGDFSANTVDINGSLNIAFAGGYLNYKPNNTACANNDYLKWDNSNNRWICATPSGGMGGSGTTGRIPRFTASTTLGDSMLQVVDNTAGTLNVIGTLPEIQFNGNRYLHTGSGTGGGFDGNVFVGMSSGNATQSGARNIGMGYVSLFSLTSGNDNVALGAYSMRYATTASENIAIGAPGLAAITTGSKNIGIGGGDSITTGSENVVVGIGALTAATGNDNTALGNASLNTVTTGSNNTALGKYAGYYANGASASNVFLGSGSGPTALGAISNKLYIDNSANDTPLIGGDFSSRTVNIGGGALNVGYGTYANNTTLTVTGQQDAAIRLIADTDNAVSEGHNPYIEMSQDNLGTYYIMGVTGTAGTTPNETALTDALGNTLFLGTNNVAGNIQFATGGSGGATYGVRMTILDDGKVGIGTNAPSEALDVTGNVRATSFISTSDRRLKQNIRSIAGMSAINQLRGVQYEWRADGTSDAGVIAQEVEKVFPFAVRTDSATGFKAVKYNYLIAPLIEATKENYKMCKQSEAQIKDIQRSIASIQAKDSAQDKELQALRAENASLKQRLDAIEKKLGIK